MLLIKEKENNNKQIIIMIKKKKKKEKDFGLSCRHRLYSIEFELYLVIYVLLFLIHSKAVSHFNFYIYSFSKLLVIST